MPWPLGYAVAEEGGGICSPRMASRVQPVRCGRRWARRWRWRHLPGRPPGCAVGGSGPRPPVIPLGSAGFSQPGAEPRTSPALSVSPCLVPPRSFPWRSIRTLGPPLGATRFGLKMAGGVCGCVSVRFCLLSSGQRSGGPAARRAVVAPHPCEGMEGGAAGRRPALRGSSA